MIESVKVTNYVGESIVMDLKRPEKSGFSIFNIEGIGPVQANIRTTDLVTGDGGVFNSAKLYQRNIVITALFMEKETIEDMRHESYKYFPVKRTVTLTITTEDRICEITGYVESNNPVIFSKESYMQVSIICPYPYFYAGGELANNITTFFGVDGLFEFPFSNETVGSPHLIFGELRFAHEELVYNSGDADVGIIMYLEAIGPATNVTIHNVETRQSLFIDTTRLMQLTGKGLVAGDQIIISSVFGDKHILLLRDGMYTNILNVLDKGSTWFTLSRGDNIFAFTAETGAHNLLFRIENRILYEGV